MSATESTRGRVALTRGIVALLIFAGFSALLILFVPEDFYPWIKALHIIAVIAWMAGLLYLPRLFVYHSEAAVGSEKSETFKIMERRLLRAIINPAMIATWSFGLWLAWKVFAFQGSWLHAKITLVLLLSGLHGYLSKGVRTFAQDRNTKSTKHWRIVNEVPTVLMILIVILVVVKPF
ncbi:protoporphyrinogen oxidase HemJ [Mesorhizobium sp. RP14(2022)]|uniref:Protoporphyrinogen IX oxidase n=1 Tax=Mesorhizobium liriopis TaxID=2953882 RepID=A0ABT1C219_9HYPH|nr:protoporphyrinogen oxidase HemJ [Mesorhizobium liriopis]MCO6048873.1 protoporphyrinogen oxidase HemJ [Mesorhizobium liriopis]